MIENSIRRYDIKKQINREQFQEIQQQNLLNDSTGQILLHEKSVFVGLLQRIIMEIVQKYKNIQMYNIQDSMISSQEYKNSKLYLKQSSSQLIQKCYKIDITKLNLQGIKELHPALNNTYICVDYQYQNLAQYQPQPQSNSKTSPLAGSSNLASSSSTNVACIASLGYQPGSGTSTLASSVAPMNNNNHVVKKVIHFTSDCKILGQLIIKQPEYELFMLSQNFVNLFEYSDKKTQSCIVQWNLQTHQTINVNYNRQILPMLKIFSFSQSDTFCIVQYDQNIQNTQKQKEKQKAKQEQTGTYHTKFKLAYFKFPLKKQHQKPHIVFKTHTNPKEYGFNQEIRKLNNHSMVGSISTKTNQNDQTLLKTFDFKNNPMGVQVNYKFHVQINYRKELLQLWITDIWEIRPENFYLKCEMKIDRNKQQKFFMQFPNKTSSEIQNIQECLHLTWAYKCQNTLKFAKFKTSLLNHIQFTDSFNVKQRIRILYQKSVTKQKIIKIQPIYTSNQMLPLPLSSSINPLSTMTPTFNLSSSTSSVSSTSTFTSVISSQGTVTPSTNSQISNSGQKVEQVYLPPTYIKSVHRLPIFFINNSTEQIVLIEREYCDWMISYPAYSPRALFFYRNSKQNDKILEIAIYKMREVNNNKQMSIFLLNSLYENWDMDLVKNISSMLQTQIKYRQLQTGWRPAEANKFGREVKSKSNIENKLI